MNVNTIGCGRAFCNRGPDACAHAVIRAEAEADFATGGG